MSKEFANRDARIATGVQTSAPNGPDGQPDGDPSSAVPGRPQETISVPPSQPLAPAGKPIEATASEPGMPTGTRSEATSEAALAVHRAGEPGTLPLTWCKKCAADVRPEGKGVCPRCRTFLRLNFVSRKHPINRLRKQQLLDKLIADYRPDSQRLHSACEQYAGVLEQLEVLKAGSQEHKRLVELSMLLGTMLEESRKPADAHTHDDVGEMNTDQLIEHTTEILRGLLDTRDAEQRATLPAAESSPFDSSPFDSSPIADVVTIESSQPAPEPVCPYCRRPCVGPDHDAFSVLHWDDPAEIEKRATRATDEMWESMRRQALGHWPPQW
jgi:hypothetical protein